MRSLLGLWVVLLGLASGVPPAYAWGAEGHRIIAFIGASQLDRQARAEVARLLGGPVPQAMVRVSTWADEIRRDRPRTAPWHYVDIPFGSAGYDAARDCRHGDCVVAQIERDQRLIADRSLAPSVRAEALRFLIHFVGDVHQPLHAANDDDRGGNEIHVVLNGRRSNLHAVWDDAVVRALGRSPRRIAQRLETRITPADRSRWQRGSAVDWANESFAIATRDIYARFRGRNRRSAPLILPRSYARDEAPLAARQLEKAGVRLAWLLNRAFARSRR